MALGDYRLCDVCDSKVFYDSNLNYEWPDKDGNDSWGNKIEKVDMVRNSEYKLDYLGDWAVICSECAQTHKCIVVPIDTEIDVDKGCQQP